MKKSTKKRSKLLLLRESHVQKGVFPDQRLTSTREHRPTERLHPSSEQGAQRRVGTPALSRNARGNHDVSAAHGDSLQRNRHESKRQRLSSPSQRGTSEVATADLEPSCLDDNEENWTEVMAALHMLYDETREEMKMLRDENHAEKETKQLLAEWTIRVANSLREQNVVVHRNCQLVAARREADKCVRQQRHRLVVLRSRIRRVEAQNKALEATLVASKHSDCRDASEMLRALDNRCS